MRPFLAGLFLGYLLVAGNFALYRPIDITSLVNKYESQIATVSAELNKEREYSKELLEDGNQDNIDNEEYIEARCVCKSYSGKVDRTGQFIESYPENRKLTPKQICKI